MSDEGKVWHADRIRNKAQKQRNLKQGEQELEILVAFDFKVREMSPYHFRINETLDVWPSTKKYWDIEKLKKGRYENLVEFVKQYFK